MNIENPYPEKLNIWSSHSQIASLLEGLPEGSRILDVGIGSGIIARLCSGRGYLFRGIDPNIMQLGTTASLYTEIFEGTLEQTPDSYLMGHSAVVCGDILEHLVHPVEQLQRLVSTQSIGCLFIISVPNVANIWVRFNLLIGRFDYTNRGILDQTHLHFYTHKTFLQLLHEGGLRVRTLIATPIPLELVAPSFSQTTVGKALYHSLNTTTKWLPSLLGYQWIAKAYKS